MSDKRQEAARNARYRKAALADMSLDSIINGLYEISDTCGNVHWAAEDDEVLMKAFDGDDEEVFEFKVAFSDIEYKCDSLIEQLNSARYEIADIYDDCTVALIGNRYNLIGFDDYEEDYFSLTSFEAELGEKESAKRLMRLTKAQMISTIGQCIGILLAYHDLKTQYDALKATLDIFNDDSSTLIDQIKKVEKLYEEAAQHDFNDWDNSTRAFNALVDTLPERMWVE